MRISQGSRTASIEETTSQGGATKAKVVNGLRS
jgi:hypothetical protein